MRRENNLRNRYVVACYASFLMLASLLVFHTRPAVAGEFGEEVGDDDNNIFWYQSNSTNSTELGNNSVSEELGGGEYYGDDKYESESPVEMTPAIFRSILLIPRITGSITFVSSLCMTVMAWKRRNQVFHRLVLGLSINLLIFGVALIIGGWAVPADENPVFDESQFGEDANIVGYYGTTATCTMQGFAFYFCGHVAAFYFAFLSVYSYVGVTNNYEKSKYVWIEKYIHVIAQTLPLSVALVFLGMEGFNNLQVGTCYVSHYPYGCEVPGHEREFVACERGPRVHGIPNSNYLYLQTIPEALAIVVPTILLIALYIEVKRHQDDVNVIQAKTVGFQGTLYLATIYWIALPVLGTAMVPIDWIYFYVFAIINFQIFGLWTILMYLYFTIPRKNSNTKINAIGNGRDDGDSSGNIKNNRFPAICSHHTSKTISNRFWSSRRPSSALIFSPEDLRAVSNNIDRNDSTGGNASSINHDGSIVHRVAHAPAPATGSSSNPSIGKRSSSTSTISVQKYTFNIFDGTNATGGFADFVFEGDDSEKEEDEQDIQYWSGVQGL